MKISCFVIQTKNLKRVENRKAAHKINEIIEIMQKNFFKIAKLHAADWRIDVKYSKPKLTNKDLTKTHFPAQKITATIPGLTTLAQPKQAPRSRPFRGNIIMTQIMSPNTC